MSDRPPSSYDFVPLPDRAPLKFPNSANVALIFTINLEYWEPSRPGQKEPMFPGGPATIPHALPGDVLDTANWTWREYGQRIGIWRGAHGLKTKAFSTTAISFGVLQLWNHWCTGSEEKLSSSPSAATTRSVSKISMLPWLAATTTGITLKSPVSSAEAIGASKSR